MERRQFLESIGIGAAFVLTASCLQSCTKDNSGPVDFTIDLKTASYSGLKTKGAFSVVKAQNVIVAHTNADAWIAVDSRCTHELTVIDYRASTNDFLCPNHGSVFTATGAVTKGPANSALTRYNTSFDATNNTLRVFA